MESWDVLDGVLMPPWLTFKNQSIGTALEFSFNPPLTAQGTNFTIEMVLADHNLLNPQKSSYEISVSVE